MATATSEGVPEARHQLTDRLRAAVLGPRGGGTTRRRASDAFRLGLAVVVVAVSIPVMRANSAAELGIVRAVHPPTAADVRALTLLACEQERIPAARVGFHLAALGSPPVPGGSPPASDGPG